MTSLAESLREWIRAEGPISVEAYMAACNEHYYATRDPLGAAGDFTTAPEISQMFGELVGACLADCWRRAGKPKCPVYIELGPGRGTLAADALRVMEKAGLSTDVELVEASPALIEEQSERFDHAYWHSDLTTIQSDGSRLIVANEFFDALPIRQWVGEEERKVASDGDQFQFTADGPIREDAPARDRYAWEIGAQLDVYGGVALIIDYGHTRSAPGDTLQAVKEHRFADPLANPGEQDLTAHVDFEALAKAIDPAINVIVSGPVTQGEWLRRLGIDQRAQSLIASNPDKRHDIEQAMHRLCGRDEMGDLFKVMAIRSAAWPEPAGFAR
jgi:SAM-dependent MidA family methyltransferase